MPEAVYNYRIGGNTSRYMPYMLDDFLRLYRFKTEMRQKHPMPQDAEYFMAVELLNVLMTWFEMYKRQGKHTEMELIKEIGRVAALPEVQDALRVLQDRNKKHRISGYLEHGEYGKDRGNGDAEAEKGSAQAAAQANSVFAVNEQEHYMIPRKIHYWLDSAGGKAKAGHRNVLPAGKILPGLRDSSKWNEDNFDVNRNAYTQMCYKEKKYAFLTDYLRLLIVEEHGGIYFDTDVEAVHSFDELLDNPAFFGFENDRFVNTGEASARNPITRRCGRCWQNTTSCWTGSMDDRLPPAQYGCAAEARAGAERRKAEAERRRGIPGGLFQPKKQRHRRIAENGEYPFDPLVFGKLDAMAQAAAVGDQQTGAFYPGEGKRTWQMIQSG